MSRKVTTQICSAFEMRRPCGIANSSTDGKVLLLHGHRIAEHKEDGLYITNAGYQTNVTKERLNGLSGVSISQKQGVWYLNGTKWDGEWIKVS